MENSNLTEQFNFKETVHARVEVDTNRSVEEGRTSEIRELGQGRRRYNAPFFEPVLISKQFSFLPRQIV
jgi:hypothetical protein